MLLAIPMLLGMLGDHAAPPARDPIRNPAEVEYHVRTSDPLVRAWIRYGAAQSRTLNDLLTVLAASDVIVHVQLVDRIAGGADGQLYFVTATATARYLRAEITRIGSRADTIALIAHELQHAAEVASSPRVRDSVSMSTFYLGMSENGRSPGRYDSQAARLTQDVVRREVIAHRGEPDDEVQLTAMLRASPRPAR